MLRRLAIMLFSLSVFLSIGGILCAQAQASSASACCKNSCPQSQHREPTKCCRINLAQSTIQVPSAHQGAPDPVQIATASFAHHLGAPLDLIASASRRIHPPPVLALSPAKLCSLQI
jgi:hypothetical protein